ncbi:hypothetical protein HPB48_012890 [Haemaphysalis longicornis]|uniref:Uncharacterized protein n=1 Tax=Haemaphysalis longicornis TaxID=44386 RepID=A0A9J6GM12_HAELO|nr:hypothetical protein HPB48_012890 [Haemaphysalis longicornis]
MKEAKEFYYNHTLSTFIKDNPSKFWKTICPIRSDAQSFFIDDQPCSDASVISEAFNIFSNPCLSLKMA